MFALTVVSCWWNQEELVGVGIELTAQAPLQSYWAAYPARCDFTHFPNTFACVWSTFWGSFFGGKWSIRHLWPVGGELLGSAAE